jgi:hypothetical protein
MSSRERERWETLQTRWAAGDALSAAEERERLAFAAYDSRARRELEVFAALRARAADDREPASGVFIERVLEASRVGPRLRLIGSEEADAFPVRTKAQSSSARLWLSAAAGLGLTAALAGVLLAVANAPNHFVALAPNKHAASHLFPEVARAELAWSAGQVLIDGQVVRLDRRELAPGQVLATGEGRACLTIDPTIDVCVAEHSKIRLESLAASSIRVRVETGLALASLSRRNPGSSFALLASDVTAIAVGTIFAARQEAQQTEIIVVEGRVEVTGGASSEQVGARSRVLIRRGENVFERSKLGPAEEARLLELRVMNGVGLRSGSGGLAPDSKAPLSRQPRGSSSEPVEKPSPAALLEAARAEVARGNGRAALALYEKVRALYPASPEGHTVLPTIGKLQLDLGESERALRSFDAYLQNPGMLAPEALSGRIKALRALRQRSAEREAIQQYLTRYPKGLEQQLFEKRLTELDSP